MLDIVLHCKFRGLIPFIYNSIKISLRNLYIWFILMYSSTYRYILQYTMSIALYAMFSFIKRFAKLCIISRNRTHDLMHTARLHCPLHHQRWCRYQFVHGISLIVCLLAGLGCIAGRTSPCVRHLARGPPRHLRRPWRHQLEPSGSLGVPVPGLGSQGTQAQQASHWTRSWSCHQCLRHGCEFRVRLQAQAF
jgi:hypothetical protein